MRKKFTMLLASLFLTLGTAWAQVYQKIPHTKWTVTALNQAVVQGNEGGIDFLKDENPETFYHSDYSNSYSDGNSGKKKGQDGLQAFMVELPEVMPIDKITYKGRSNGGNNWAIKARIYVFKTLPDGWPKDGEAVKQLSAMTYAEKEDLLKRTENTVLGTPAFDNNDNGTWAADQNIKTAEFSSTQQGKYILFVADATTGGNGYLCCGDFHVWQKLEGIVEDKPYFLKINGLDDYYLDTRVGVSSDYGNTISKTQTPIATYFTLNDGYWHVSSLPGNERNFVGITNWDAIPGKDTPANWTLHKVDAKHSLWSLAQSTYYGSGDATKHYLGANDGNISGNTKVYTDKTIEQAVKFQLVVLTEEQTTAEATRVVAENLAYAKEKATAWLNRTGAGYPAVDSEARTTLLNAINAADATRETVEVALAAYQAHETVVMPEVGKVYRLVSGYTAFTSKKALYSDNNELKWQNKNDAAMNQLWTVQSMSNGNIVLMNVADALYPQKTDYTNNVTMFSAKNECSILFCGKGQFQVFANKLQRMFANGHNNGSGESGNITNYNDGGADSYSSWYFEEVSITKDILSKQIESLKAAYIGSLLVKQESVTGLQTAVNEAVEVCNAEGNYAAAFANLVATLNTTTIDYIEQGYFRMKSKVGGKYAYNDNTSLKATTDYNSPKTIIKLTEANNGTFYIQNGNGYYAQGVSTSAIVNTAASAVEYVITRLASDHYVLRPKNSTTVRGFWHQDGSSNVVGWGSDAGNTQWTFEALTVEEAEKIYAVRDLNVASANVYVTYNGEGYTGDKDVKQAGGFYVLDNAPTTEDFTVVNADENLKAAVYVNGNSLSVHEGYDGSNIYILKCLKDNSYARYHNGSKLSAEDETNMLTYENNNLHFESLFFIEEGEDDYKGYYTIRSVAAPTMYAYNLGTEDKDSKVAMKEAPAEGDLTGAYYWKISNFGSKETSNITPWGEGGDAFGWNKRGDYNGYHHIGYWKDHNTYNDNKWYVNIVKDELVEKFIPLHTVANSVIGYATYESVEAVLPYTEVVTAEGINKLKNAQFNVVAPQVGKYYRLKNEVSGLYMSGDESNITLVEKEHQVSTIFYLDENYALKSHNTGRYLDCDKKDYADGDNKPAGTFGFAYGGMKPNVITYNNNNRWTFGANSKGDNKLDRGSNTPNAAGYNWILEEGDVDVWEAKAELVPLMEELYDPWASPMPLQVADATAGYYLSSCGSADGNVEANMIDGKNETFYGSPWGASVNGIDYHYWQVDLGNGVTLKDFVFSYTTRANGNDMPTEIIVKGSADGVKFDEITTISEGLPDGASEEYCSKTIVPTADNYRYVRFEVTGTNNNFKPLGHATQRTIAIAEFAMWQWQYKHLFDAQAVIDNKAATLDEVNQAYLNLKMMNVEKPTYPFTVTTDDENPVLYAIKSGRTNDGKEWWYTYDSGDGKIALSQYAGSDNQFWFFKEVVTADYQYALQLYPYADPTKAMSYENTNNDAAKIVAQTLGAEGWTNLWLIASTDDKAPYGLQTYDKKNYLSNNGGVDYKMGMWNAAPNADGGTAMYFYTQAEALQNLIAQAEVLALSGHYDEVGYYSSATANALRAAIAQAEANLENKNYSVTELNTAIANLSVILPQAGKYYQIKSAKPEFYEKHQKEMAIYSDATSGKLSWKVLDATDKSFYWTMTPNAEGTSFTVQNAGDNKYVPAVITEEGNENKDRYIMTSELESAQGFTLKLLTLGQFNIIGGGTMHALNHGGGANTSGDICSHDGGIDSPSAWTIVEVEHPDLAVAKINLQAKIDELKPIVEYSGSNPGSYKEAEVAKFADKFAAAEDVMKGGSSEPAVYVEALEILNNAVVGLDLEVIPVTAGLYRIVSASSSFTEDKGMTAYAYDGYYRKHCYPGWAPVDENDPLQYWLLEDNGDGTFNLKAAYEGNYMTTATSMSETAKAVTFTALGKAQFNIRLAGDSDPLHCNGWNWGHPSAPLTTWGGGVDSNSSWRLVAVTEKPTFTYDLTVGSVGYATLMLGFDAEIPDGVTCYAVKVNAAESGADLSAITGDVLPANTPVIVTAADKTYTFASTDKVATAPKANELMGTLYPKIITPETGYTCYVLANPKDKDTGEFKGVGLYKASLNKNENTAFLNNANKVYLPVPVVDAKAPRALMFRFGGTTEIENVETTANGQQPTAVYDLQGRRVLNPTKGMYIVNGKKVLF